MLCPCHSQKPYEECCAPYHKGELPPNALALMRSRYSAYALGLIDYIIATTHPDHPDYKKLAIHKKKELLDFSKNTSFLNLEILEFTNSLPYSTVTFRAYLERSGKDFSFTEKSEFAQIEGRWLYRKALSLS